MPSYHRVLWGGGHLLRVPLKSATSPGGGHLPFHKTRQRAEGRGINTACKREGSPGSRTHAPPESRVPFQRTGNAVSVKTEAPWTLDVGSGSSAPRPAVQQAAGGRPPALRYGAWCRVFGSRQAGSGSAERGPLPPGCRVPPGEGRAPAHAKAAAPRRRATRKARTAPSARPRPHFISFHLRKGNEMITFLFLPQTKNCPE